MSIHVNDLQSYSQWLYNIPAWAYKILIYAPLTICPLGCFPIFIILNNCGEHPFISIFIHILIYSPKLLF